MKLIAATLKPKRCFVHILPRTGISSIPYFRLKTEGTDSMPFRIGAKTLNSSVFRLRCSSARSFDFTDMTFTAVRFENFDLH